MLPVPTSQSANKLRVLKKEYNTVRMQMNATSSQDEFAKWAKLRRKSDKLGEEIEGCSKFLHSLHSAMHSHSVLEADISIDVQKYYADCSP
jgi:hypothetical protein